MEGKVKGGEFCVVVCWWVVILPPGFQNHRHGPSLWKRRKVRRKKKKRKKKDKDKEREITFQIVSKSD